MTLQTVADAVGVSRSTASNAFSRPDQLSDELRRRILDAAAELGYPGPHPAARTLRRGRAGTVGLLFTENLSYAFADPYAVGFIQGLAEATQRASVGLLLVPAPPGQATNAAIGDAVVDAFCVYSMPDDHPAVDIVRRRGLPVVFVDEPLDPASEFVGIDDYAAARTAAAHALELGHTRLGVLSTRVRDDDQDGPVNRARLEHATFRISRSRIRGYLDAVQTAGLAPQDVPIIESSRNSREAGRRAGDALLTLAPRPTAVLALSDQLALGVLDAAHQRGMAVPGDLSVIGFDDIPAAAPAGLTTIRQPIQGKGREAGRLLIDRQAAGQPPRHRLLPTRLIIRHTSGPFSGVH